MTLREEVYSVAREAAKRRLYEPDGEFRALVDEGRRMADRGEYAAAERLFKGALLATRGVSKANESYALASLMTIYQRTQRHFESLVLARLMAERLLRAGETAKGVGCLAVQASCLITLGLHDETNAVLVRLGDLLEQVPVDANTMAHENYHYFSGWIAARAGRTKEALRHLVAFRDIKPRGESRGWRKPTEEAFLEGLIALSENEPAQAVARLSEAYASTPAAEARLELRRAKIEALHQHGDLKAAQAAARALLDAVAGLANDPIQASLRIRLGTWLALWLDNHGGEPALVQKAYDVAAAAVIERICQLDGAIDDLPELGAEGAAHLDALKGVRKQFVAQQKELLARVADFLHTTDGGIAAEVLYGARQDGYVRVCAWCESLSTDEARWLPVGHFVPRGPEGLQVTHTICPTCAARLA